MRDTLLLTFIALCLTVTLRYPFVGMLTWAWFTLMTPHQLAYGVYGIPLNTLIAGVTIVAFIIAGEARKIRVDTLTIMMVLFGGWVLLAQNFSLNPENSAPYTDRLVKTMIFVVLCAQMVNTQLRFNAMVWMLVGAIGFFAAKGGLFTLATLGQFRVQGLPETVLEDNNHLGIAMATILPMILYLRTQAANGWVRRGLLALFALTIVAIVGTFSRGAFLAMIAFAGVYWLRSKYKITIAAGLAMLMVPTIIFMPSKWTERMTSIGSATEDASFMGRVDAWKINYKLAKDNPLTGAGLRNSYHPEIAATVDPALAERARAAHSIYFEILGGAGFVGLAIFLMLYGGAFLLAWRIYLAGRKRAPNDWQASFGFYAQISLVIFAVGGASTSMEMWDGYLLIIALIAALSRMADVSLRGDKNPLEIYGLHTRKIQRKHPV
ncbi:MAG: putative O-glycosylation ligase, exosortase A system-associated [Marinicaulis sp.]|nr:putative O-glycosylation ligase, exosortase A system-associated [Marinicaulis sp.]